MDQGRLARGWDDYLSVLREDAHLLLAWGYADVRSEIPSARDEYDITGLLADAMEARINDPKTPERFSLYSVHNERPISVGGERGKGRPKLDIEIERCGIRPRQSYTFEAKRLRDDAKASPSDSVAHYLGDDGVCRFVTGRYAPEALESVMLGLIQAHTAEFWFARMQQAFEDDSASGDSRFSMVEGFEQCSVIPELPDEASTVHRRVNGSIFRLLHLLIGCA